MKKSVLVAFVAVGLLHSAGAISQEATLQFSSRSTPSTVNLPPNLTVGTVTNSQSDESEQTPAEVVYEPSSCQQILSDGQASGTGVYTIYPQGVAVDVICDMDTDGGGWQLVTAISKSSQPSTLRDQNSYPSNINAVVSLDAPQSAYMYKGSLSRFTSAREGVSCQTASNCKTVYGSNLSQSQLNDIRSLMGSTARIVINQGRVPSCTTSYAYFQSGVNNLRNCEGVTRSDSATVSTVSGWQVDTFGTSHCWMMRSSTSKSTLKGSGRCVSSGEPNGSLHGLLWMR